MLHSEFHYHIVLDQANKLVGYCCFGPDAQVTGGLYHKALPTVVDIGLGLHPKLIGRGWGKIFLRAILTHAREIFEPETFRATIMAFNLRSLRAFEHHNFQQTHEFMRSRDHRRFIQVERTT